MNTEEAPNLNLGSQNIKLKFMLMLREEKILKSLMHLLTLRY